MIKETIENIYDDPGIDFLEVDPKVAGRLEPDDKALAVTVLGTSVRKLSPSFRLSGWRDRKFDTEYFYLTHMGVNVHGILSEFTGSQVVAGYRRYGSLLCFLGAVWRLRKTWPNGKSVELVKW